MRMVTDVAFQINETASQWFGDDTVSAAAAALPQLKGFGTVKDLHVANDNEEMSWIQALG